MNLVTPNDPLLTENEAAAYTRRSPKTLQDMRCRGRGPQFVKLGRSVFYKQSMLDAWIERSIRTPGQPIRGRRPQPVDA